MVKTLVIGYGNRLRGDDGAGPYIAQQIEQLQIPGVSVRVLHQLTPELLEDIRAYPRVLFIDAAAGGEELVLKRVTCGDGPQTASSHHLSPELFLRLARQLYQMEPELHLCSIRGEQFELSEHLSTAVQQRCREAVTQIRRLLTEG